MATRVLVPYFPAAAGETEAPAGHLHLLNLTDTAATALIAGRDRDGAAGANVFTSNSIPAHGSIRITAGHLEGGGEAGASNGLGDGRGVWSLTVTSDADLAVVAFEGAAPNLEPLPVETLPPLPPPAPEPEPEPQPEPIPTGPARVEIQGFEIRTNIETTRYEWSATVRNAGGVTLRDVYVHPRAVWQGGRIYGVFGQSRHFHNLAPGERGELRGNVAQRGLHPGAARFRLCVAFDADGSGLGPEHCEAIDVPRMFAIAGRAVSE